MSKLEDNIDYEKARFLLAEQETKTIQEKEQLEEMEIEYE